MTTTAPKAKDQAGAVQGQSGPLRIFWVGMTLYAVLLPGFSFWQQLQGPWPETLVGRDFTNLWMAGYLALHGRVAEIFDIAAFRQATSTILGTDFSNSAPTLL